MGCTSSTLRQNVAAAAAAVAAPKEIAAPHSSKANAVILVDEQSTPTGPNRSTEPSCSPSTSSSSGCSNSSATGSSSEQHSPTAASPKDGLIADEEKQKTLSIASSEPSLEKDETPEPKSPSPSATATMSGPTMPCIDGTKMDTLETGTKKYLSLYPEKATDGNLHLGNIVPDFYADTTDGLMQSFHKWKADQWAILLSHPADLDAVSTSELHCLATRYDDLAAMRCLVACLSPDSVSTHRQWLDDVQSGSDSGSGSGDAAIDVKFPLIADPDRDIAVAYSVIDAYAADAQTDLPLAIRSVFIISPEHRLLLRFNYPAHVGRNIDEIVRCVQALQLSYAKSVATPANWPLNQSSTTLPRNDGSSCPTMECYGSVYLLPTVSNEDANKAFSNVHTCEPPSKRPYLRLVSPSENEFGEQATLRSAAAPLEAMHAALQTRAKIPAPEIGHENVAAPEKCSTSCLFVNDGTILLGDAVPNFSADTTQGPIESFYEWKANQWAILLSHPADFGPVCTSELAALVTMHSQLVDMNCRVAAVSPNDVASHELWIRDIVAYGNNDASIKGLPFPILADKNRDIATAYNMIDPWSSDMQRIPLTIRSVFIISPNNRLALTLNYPSHVGRNMDEIVRCLYALQQSYGRTGTASIATPANWPLNDAKVSLEDGV